MTRAHWTSDPALINACQEAIEWARDYATVDAAWAACQRGDWMLWLVGRIGASSEAWSEAHKSIALAACACARLSLPHARDARVLECIETTERWCAGSASPEEVRAASKASYVASYAAYAAAHAVDGGGAAAYAAYAAAHAAGAAYAAGAAAADANIADATAAGAAYAAGAAADANVAARMSVLAQCADLVRNLLPCPVLGGDQ